MNPEIPREELTDVLEEVAMEILSRTGVEGPPVNSLGVARGLGMSVAWDDRQAGRARLVRERPRAALRLSRRGGDPPRRIPGQRPGGVAPRPRPIAPTHMRG